MPVQDPFNDDNLITAAKPGEARAGVAIDPFGDEDIIQPPALAPAPAFQDDPSRIAAEALGQPVPGELFIEQLVKPALQDPLGRVIKPVAGIISDIGSGVLTAGAGVKQVGAEALGRFTGVDPSIREAVIEAAITAPEVARQQEFAEAREQAFGAPPGLGVPLGEAALPIPGPKKATAFGRMLEGMKLGGLAGALEFTEGGTADRAKNTLFGIAAGGTFQPVLDIFRAGRGAVSKKGRITAALDSPLLSRVEVKAVIQAAKDLNITITPGEAAGDVFLISGESQLSVGKATRAELRDFLEARHEKLVQNITALRNRAVSGSSFAEHATQLETLKQDVFSQTLDKEVLASMLKESPVLKVQFEAFNAALKKGGKKLTATEALAVERMQRLQAELGLTGDLPVTNVGFIDVMMDNLDSFVDVTSKGGKKAFRDISKTRSALSERLKKEIPGYGDYKALSQRALAVNHMDNVLAQLPDRTPGDIASGFYDAVLRKPANRDELIGLMAQVPGAEKKIQDLSKVMGSIFADESLRRTIQKRLPDLLAEGGTAGLGPLGAATIRLRKFLGGEHDRAIMEYITNPAWTQDITALSSRDKLQTMNNLAAYLARVANAREKVDTQQRVPSITEAAQSLL